MNQTILNGLTPVQFAVGVVLAFFVIIPIATFLHELAHYALARWQGVAVKSFSVGMGPVFFRREWRGTEWRLSLLPIGGYVEIDGMVPEPGEDGAARPPQRGFARLPAWGKIAVLLAGPLMNLLLAISLMTITFAGQGVPAQASNRILISRVQDSSIASRLGLSTGDVIVAIDGKEIPDTFSVLGEEKVGWMILSEILKESGKHSLKIERDGSTRNFDFSWVAQVNGEKQLLGVGYGPDVIYNPTPLPVAFAKAWQVTAQAVPRVVQSFAGLFYRFLTLNLSRDENVSGPIGTAEIAARAAIDGPWYLVQVATLLNLSLAFFNLIPIPGLDGGRILLVLVGSLRGRPLSFAQEQAINLAGFAFVMLLMVFVVVRDVSRFF